MIKVKSCKKIITGNKGWLLEIASDRDGFTEIKGQIYMITINPGVVKGYHMHKGTDYYVTCIKGKVRHVVYPGREESIMGDDDFKTVFMPKGSAHAIENLGNEVAYVLMYRTVAWDPDDFYEQVDVLPEKIEECYNK